MQKLNKQVNKKYAKTEHKISFQPFTIKRDPPIVFYRTKQGSKKSKKIDED